MRFAPLYDAVTTRLLPRLAHDRMALKLNGKDDRLTQQDFIALARTIELPLGKARTALGEMTRRVEAAAPRVSLPAFARGERDALAVEEKVRSIVKERADGLG